MNTKLVFFDKLASTVRGLHHHVLIAAARQQLVGHGITMAHAPAPSNGGAGRLPLGILQHRLLNEPRRGGRFPASAWRSFVSDLLKKVDPFVYIDSLLSADRGETGVRRGSLVSPWYVTKLRPN